MATLSVSIPEDLKAEMFEFEEMNWSAVAKKAFEQKISDMDFFKKISEKSKFTEKDAKELADMVNKAASKRFLEMNKK